MKMSSITDRLPVGKELRELKLGKTFKNGSKFSSSNPGYNNSNNCDTNGDAFHTIRYDFKPASVDPGKTGAIEFDENNKVTVTAPNVDASGVPYTVFKGSRKPHSKECVLIIDHETGEIVLERLSQNIAVKKTRIEGSSKANLLQRPITPSMESNDKRNSPPLSSGSQSQVQTVQSVHSGQIAKSISPKTGDPFGSVKNGKSSLYASNMMSANSSRNSGFEATLNFIPSTQNPQTNGRPPNTKVEDDMVGVLSESSSDSSDNESSSSNSSSEDECEPEGIPQNGGVRATNGTSSAIPVASNGAEILGSDSSSDSDSGSGSDSSEDEEEEEKRPTKSMTNGSTLPSMPNGLSMPSMPNVLSMPSMPNSNSAASLPSMPKFSQLSQDLQLSESGSDSD